MVLRNQCRVDCIQKMHQRLKCYHRLLKTCHPKTEIQRMSLWIWVEPISEYFWLILSTIILIWILRFTQCLKGIDQEISLALKFESSKSSDAHKKVSVGPAFGNKRVSSRKTTFNPYDCPVWALMTDHFLGPFIPTQHRTLSYIRTVQT